MSNRNSFGGSTVAVPSQAIVDLQNTVAKRSGFNYCINGAPLISQRGAGPFTTTGAYGVDRWRNDISVAPASFSCQVFTEADGTKSHAVSCNTTGIMDYSTKLENLCNLLSGRTITVSFEALAVAGPETLQYFVQNDFDNSLIVNYTDYTITSTGTFEAFEFTFTVPTGSSANEQAMRFGFRWNNQNTDIRFRNFKVEEGTEKSVFTDFDYEIEESRCQRYYVDARKVAYPGACGLMCFAASGGVSGTINFPVTMRTTPTLAVSYAGAANTVVDINSGTPIGVAPITQTWADTKGINGFQFNATLTVGLAYGFDYTADAEL